ncbi:MAG TPA: ROK family protein [Sphingobacteriaceae bacterium]
MMGRAVIGVDLGGTNVRSGHLVDGRITRVDSRPISSRGTQEAVLQDLIHSIEAIMTPDVGAIGIGVPAVVDTRQGIVYDVQNIPSWHEVPLRALLEQHFGVPVLVNNDANCFAAGEWYYGRAKGYQDVVGLILGTGVAAGLICNNQLYEGRNCGAGEFGMLPYLEHNLEFYASGNYFRHFHHLSGEEVFNRARTGDPDALQIFHEYGRHVSMVVRAVLFAMDPQIIILGGSVSKAYPYFEKSLWHHLQDFPYRPVIQNIKIEPSEAENIAIYGAAALHLGSGPTDANGTL